MAKLAKIVVALDTHKMDVPTLISAAKGVKTTSDPDVTDPPVTDLQLGQEATDLQNTHSKRYIDQSKSLTRTEESQRAILEFSYAQVGHYVQDVANKVAISNGSVSKGEAVVERCGFKLKKKGEKPSRAFEVVESGPGWIHLRVKSVGIKAGYLWRFGITSEKNKAPGVFLPILFTLECDIIITNLTSGVLYGYQVASILPVSRTPETDPALTTVTKKSSVMLSTKSKKASFTVGVDPYNWSDIMYVGSM